MSNLNLLQQEYIDYVKPGTFLYYSKKLLPWLYSMAIFSLILASYIGLFHSSSDFQQGESYRIIYIHVPAAWIALLIYIQMTITSLLYIIYKHPIAFLSTKSASKVGLIVTAITLITGSLWGKPMWGTFWVWDARLTSVLLLFFLYLGYFAIIRAFENTWRAATVSSILVLTGFFNIPIIKFSVDWWQTLHQSSTITQMVTTIHFSMLLPLLFMTVFLLIYSLIIFIWDLRNQILHQKKVVIQHTFKS